MGKLSARMLAVELICKIVYLGGFVGNLTGLVTAQHVIRLVARPFCGFSLALLLLCWKIRLGWINPQYAILVIVGLASTVLGDLVLAQPVTDFLDYTGFLFHLFALLFFVAAVSLPSNPDASHVAEQQQRAKRGAFTKMMEAAYGKEGDASVQFRKAPAVPWRPQRAIVPVVITISCLIAWRIFGGSVEEHDPRYIATACLVTVQCLLVWRTLARIGYAAPLVSVGSLRNAAQRKQAQTEDADLPTSSSNSRQMVGKDGISFGEEDADDMFGFIAPGQVTRRVGDELQAQQAARNARQFDDDCSALESRWWQWCAVWGVVIQAAGLLCLGYDRLWLDDDQSSDAYADFTITWLTYLYTIFSWVGQTLLVSSVPCELPPIGSLHDPSICPGPTEGHSLRILIVIPFDTFDIAEVAATWYYLTKRGHNVVFATSGGYPAAKLRGVVAPYQPSVHGYGGSQALRSLRKSCCKRRSGPASSASPSGHRRPSSNSLQGGHQSVPSCLSRTRDVLFGDLLDFSAVGVGIGAPSPLIVALYRELMADSSFRRPLAYSPEALICASKLLPTKPGRKARKEKGVYTLDGLNANPEEACNYAEFMCSPESFDGMIVAGAHPLTAKSSVWDRAELQQLITRFWQTGRPLGCFSNAQILLARVKADNGLPLCSKTSLTGTPYFMELCNALLLAIYNCHWSSLRSLLCSRNTSRARSVQQELQEAVRTPTMYTAGPSPLRSSAVLANFVQNDFAFVRTPDPFDDKSAVVVEDEQLITAQCGGDAFVFARKFATKLEMVQRMF